MQKEAEKRVLEANDPEELDRLRSLSLIGLVESNHSDLIPALMARLGPVRAALDGHGGGLILASSEIEKMHNGSNAPVSYTHLRAHETREDRGCPRNR